MHKQKAQATYVYLNHERISLRDVSKKYNVPLSTLRSRYNRDLRGPELLYGKGVYSYESKKY